MLVVISGMKFSVRINIQCFKKQKLLCFVRRRNDAPFDASIMFNLHEKIGKFYKARYYILYFSLFFLCVLAC